MLPNSSRRFCLGIGLAEKTGFADALALAEGALALAGIEAGQLAIVATIESRRGHPVPQALAAHFGIGLAYFSAGELEAETPRLKNPSEELFRRIGCHGVAEAAALAAAGKDAALHVEKMKSGQVTVAIAG
jgi:cobalamin biosynthesis protein CbiG